jgi:hypothetical protein
MREVELHSKKWPGKVAQIDDQDWELISRYTWCPSKLKNCRIVYAVARANVDGDLKTIQMHRLIMGFPDCDVDHQDRNGLNNQRDNLREVTRSQNQANQAKQSRQCSSVYKGVTWDKNRGKWIAQIGFNSGHKHLGRFADEIAAARAYDAKAIELFGEYAYTNFPFSDYQLPRAA